MRHLDKFKGELNDIELVDIFGDAQVLAYVWTRQLDVGLISKENDQVFSKGKIYICEGEHILKIWSNWHMYESLPHIKVHLDIMKNANEKWQHLGVH